MEASKTRKYVKDRISVIMPCFNAQRYLQESIDCVLDQTYPDVELIVVDDGSTDGSKDIIAQYGTKIISIEQKNQGPYPARNNGLRRATGEFVAFLDSDDYWTLDCLEKLYAKLAKSDAVLSYCGWQNVGLEEKSGKPYIPPDYEKENKIERFLLAAAPWPIHAALVCHDILDTVGGFDLNWQTCMDYDLWLRIGTVFKIVLVEEVMAFYRHHSEGQITGKEWQQARNARAVKRKFVKTHPELVSSIPSKKLDEFIDVAMLRRGFRAYWRRDLVSARHIFRMALATNCWRLKDLRYILPAYILPEFLYIKLVGAIDSLGDAGKYR
jgi:glycosyltransferase involved in cell wall biosynthesis